MAGFSSNHEHDLIFEVSLIPLLTGVEKLEEIEFEFDEGQRSSLATRFGVLSIDEFFFRAELSAGDFPHCLKLKGNFFAKIVQTCVMSLENISSTIEKDIDLVLVRYESDISDLKDDTDFEYYSGQTCDIGEIMAIELALSIDPYPRKMERNIKELSHNLKGIKYKIEEEYQANEGRSVNSPFLVLEKLKKN